MPPNLNHPELGQFLGIGNIITAGIYLYRSRFKEYLKLAILAHIWLLFPLYGWAKYSATSAFIARLAFSDLSGVSVESDATKRQIDRHKWQLLIITFLVILINLITVAIAYIVFCLIFGILSFYIAELREVIRDPINSSSVLIPLLGIGVILFAGLLSSWVYSRFFIVELPYTIESNFRIYGTTQRSRQLSKKSGLFILTTILILFLITCPISYITVSLGASVIMPLLKLLPIYPYSNWSLRFLIYYVVLITLSLLTNAITMPLWQTAKAALYYSLRSRREGFDLRLSNAESAID
ncbi:MAG TPA: hypothetical protein V6C64_06130 [Microcoleaceae cyanobacterium]|jgi:hypothetical protein